jgi:hypothetical protein
LAYLIRPGLLRDRQVIIRVFLSRKQCLRIIFLSSTEDFTERIPSQYLAQRPGNVRDSAGQYVMMMTATRRMKKKGSVAR